MRVLVADACYVSTDSVYSVYFVRGRNIYYKRRGIDVSVINFAANEDCEIDNIPVYSLKSYENKLVDEKFDILICHAANIRNHYLFLKKYSTRFRKIVFFFHGQEVLRCSKVYPKPYFYVKQAVWYQKLFRDVYDLIKLKIWRNYYKELAPKSQFIFVSNWMLNEFLKWTQISPKVLNGRKHITYNNVGPFFEEQKYRISENVKYDFVTIRGNLDGSKYCIDLVVKLANMYPQYRFCIVGKGKFFKFNIKPDNVTWIESHLDHEGIISLLNISSCALMPTRTDSQGLMACEVATYGIPLITSDIPVCHEIFDKFNNVAFINNDRFENNLSEIYNGLISGVPYEENKMYFAENTCEKEVNLLEKLFRE